MKLRSANASASSAAALADAAEAGADEVAAEEMRVGGAVAASVGSMAPPESKR